jgi:hypothetical protein
MLFVDGLCDGDVCCGTVGFWCFVVVVLILLI